MQKIDGYRFHLQRPQLHRHLNEIFVSLAHPHDPAATELQARRSDGLERADPVLIGVRRADLIVELRPRIHIVVDPVHTSGFELSRLFRSQKPQANADL